MKDAADHAPIVHTILAPYIRRQIGLDLLPLIVTQPKQIASHLSSSRITELRESSTDSVANAFIGCGP
jgi:hypothetical protein